MRNKHFKPLLGQRVKSSIAAILSLAMIATTLTLATLGVSVGDADAARVPGELVRYDFVEGSGTTVGDSGSGSPLDLTIDNPSGVSWIPGGGLAVTASTVIGSTESSKIATAVGATNELTVEAWIVPQPGEQSGPARIVSNAAVPNARNFMLGQGAWASNPNDRYDGRVRSTSQVSGGNLFSSIGSAPAELTHVVFTRNAAGQRTIYIDGVADGTANVGGNFSNWDPSFPLTLANVASGNREWLGTLCLVAIYDTALTPTDITNNYNAGCGQPAGPNNDPVLGAVGNQTTSQGQNVTLNVTATDVDFDVLSYTATGLPPTLSMNSATGQITGTATTAGTYSTTITVDDGNGGTDTETITWTVDINTGPSALVRYDFVEGSGTTVGDSGSGSPLDLTIDNLSGVTWIPGGGLAVTAATVISSTESSKIATAVGATNELTVEAWITPQPGEQSGPARIVSNAAAPNSRNFMLGQGAWASNPNDRYDGRVRSTSQVSGGNLFSSIGSAPAELTHVVFTRNAAGQRTIYIDGVADGTANVGGNFSNWDPTFPLTLANVASGNREWLGTLCLVAIYDTALTQTDITNNYNAGCGQPVGPNDDPVLDVVADQTNDEGQSVAVPITGSDTDGDPLTFSATPLPAGLTVTPVDATSALIEGTIDQTAAQSSVYTTTITVNDGNGGTDTQTISWTVNPINIDPVLGAVGDQTTSQGQNVTLNVTATDVDFDVLSYTATGLPPTLSMNSATGQITGTATTAGTYSTTITVDDGNGGTDTETITWTVDINTGPSALVRYDFVEGSGTTVGDSGSGSPLDLTIDNLSGVTWIPGGGLAVTAATVISSTESSKIATAVGATNELTVEAWITPQPGEQSGPARIVSNAAAPNSRNFMLGQGAWASNPNDRYDGRVRSTSQVSGGNLFSSIGSAPAELTHVVFTRNAAGQRTIYIDGVADGTANVGGNFSNWDPTFPLTLANVASGNREWLGTLCLVAIYDTALTQTDITNNYNAGCGQPVGPNDDPVLDVVADQTNDEGQSVAVPITGSDTDGDPLTFSATPLPAGLTVTPVDATSALIEGTIDQTAAQSSVYTTTITVNDGNGGTDTQTISWTVNPINIDPVLGAVGDQTTSQGQNVTLNVTATDVDFDVLSYTATGLPPTLSMNSATGQITGTATTAGTYSTTITVDDGNGGTDTETITWTVDINTGPSALVRYDFVEGSGTTVGDSGSGSPLDLTIDNLSGVTWIPGGGLAVTAATVISSTESSKIATAVGATNELTVEAWITPQPGEQSGPARIVSNADDPFARNFMLGQGAFGSNPDDVYAGRVRTTDQASGGNLFSTDGTAPPALTHVVLTHDAAGQRTLYIDGVADGTANVSGDFSNWDPTFPLTLANVASGNREWLGTLCLVAIYDTALTQTDITNNYNAGCALATPAAEATIEITPGGGLAATTFGDSTITISNTALPGAPAITDVSFDVRGSLIPDATFDPIGTAGDQGTQCLDVSAEGGTGFIAPADPCLDPFSLPHEDAPGVVGNGWDGMDLEFADFTSGESIVFGVDVDPTTIQGVPGAGGAGAVSGLELTGSTVTVTFSDGQVLTGSLFGDDSPGGAITVVSPSSGQLAPTAIEMLGVTTTATAFPNNSQAGFVAAPGDQTVRVSGPEGATVNLLAVTGDLQSPTPFDADAYESDAATAVTYLTGTIVGGFADFVVSQTDATMLYHYVATIDDDANGPTSQQLVISIGDIAGPAALVQITPGGGLEATTFGNSTITVTNVGGAASPAITNVSFDIRGSLIPDATFDPIGTAGDQGTQCLDVSAEGGTGFVAPADPCVDPFSLPHEDAPGVVGNGWDGMDLDFTTFTSGESIVFGVDVDPTSIQGVPGAGGSGAVSGLELTGSTVTVTFSDGTVLTNQLFGDTSDGGGQALLTTTAGQLAPTAIEMLGVTTTATAFPNNSQAGFVAAPGDQTVRVSGPEDATVNLLAVTGDLQSPTPFDADAYESDAATAVTYLTGTIVGGFADFVVSQTDATMLYHYVATIDDGANGPTSQQLVISIGDIASPAALVQITPGGLIGATTFGDSTITVTNTGGSASPAITNVSFDVRGSLIPDATFDPIGTAGDEGTQCLAVSAEGGTGFVAPADPCVDPFSLPHEDDPGIPANGWDGMDLDFTTFTSGESIVFGVDVDPTSIQGVPGAGGSGAVSGLELTGSTVTVTFADGTVLTNQLFADFSAGGGQAVLSPTIGQATPTAIEMLGVTTAATVFPNNSQAGSVGAIGDQTVRVSGPEGATVNLLIVEGIVGSPTPFDLDPFESDTATAVGYSSGIIVGGVLDFVVPQPDDTLLYHYVATIDDGANGPTSEQLVIAISDLDTPVIDPIADVAANEGETVSVAINTTDPTGDPLTLDIVSTPDIEALGAVLTDNGDGTGSIDWVTEAGDAGTYTVGVTATDGTFTGNTTFTITVLDPNIVTLYRVNAGGPLVAATDGGPDWSEDQAVLGSDAGSAANPGTPSPYWIAGEDKTYGTAGAIDVSDPSIPAGTPASIFQTERYDPTGGAEMVYEFAVASGAAYEVELYFAELFATADDVREFAVDIEGTQVLVDYDVHELVGHDAGIVATFVSPVVADDALTISFTHQIENPKVNAIAIRTAGPPPTDVPPVITPIADQSMTVGGSLPIAIETTETDGDAVTLTYVSTPDTSAFTTFVDNTDGTGSLTFAPGAAESGVYDVTVTATDIDGSDTEVFSLTVNDPPVAGTVYARINAGGPLVAANDGGPDWDDDATGHTFLTDAGSDGTTGFAANDPGPTVPASVPGPVFDTERYSTSGFAYGVPVPAGTQVYVRLLLGNGFPGTSAAGSRVFNIAIDGSPVASNFDMIPAFGHQVGGMLEYLVTSDGTVDISFANVVENPLVNAIEVVSANSSPDQLGSSPAAVDFGITAVNTSQTQSVTLSNLGFDVGDPAITVTAVAVSGGEFTTNFSGPIVLGAAGTSTFDVAFAPTTLSPQSETLTITHSGTNSPLTVALGGAGSSNVPVSYDPSGLGGENLSNPTSLEFGPDGRLYVVQQNATILAYDLVRNGPNDYDVTATETISLVATGTPNHNDDGASNGTQQRQSTGLLTAGTATNPVLYVSSSDWRISVGTDSGLDTNSGVISRLTWNGASWDKVDIVRGLPRSEENHASNGMALDEASNTLYLMQGGHANKGAPGNNFSGTPEYFLSAAMLSIDLDAIEALPIQNAGGVQYVYDLPTLDDPSRGVPGQPDPGDPFGGNNGQNQAIPEPGGPVQIYSPGFRNAYDVVLTESGRLYTSDNGPNTNWGGQPLVYDSNGVAKGFGNFDQGAGDTCTNEFNEGGSTGHGDPLHFVSGPGYYGGHPAPIRAFPGTSGIQIYENTGGWTETASYNFGDLLPSGLTLADFPDNPIECEYSSNDPSKYIDIINSSTNGITEYTATNFGGSMQGDILTASFDGNIYRYKMNAAGDAFVNKEVLFSGFGSNPLDLTAQGDGEPFAGSVWAVTYGSDNITVFEPQDFGSCTGADDDLIDEDLDGFSNGDEIDNGTNPCSAASSPPDNDGDLVSDLNDLDDDDDGINDVDDEFAIDPDNGTTTDLPVLRPFDNFDPGTGFFGLGLTGLMTNGATDYLDQFDPLTLDAGGATGKLGVTDVTAGDAYQAVNTQQNAFQFGINVDTTTAPFVVHTAIEPVYFDDLTPVNFQSAGLQIGPGDQDNYLKLVINANGGAGGLQVLLEDAGTATSASQYGTADYGADILSASDVDLFLVVNPAALTAQPQVSVNGGAIVDVGPAIAIPASWLSTSNTQGMAVGVISTSTGAGAPSFTAVWDFLNVEFAPLGNTPPVLDPIADQSTAETDVFSLGVVATDADAGDTLSYALSGDVPAGMTIDGAGQIDFTSDLDDSGSYVITVEVDDATNPVVTEDFTLDVTQTDTGTVVRRINAGGPLVAATDAGPDWAANPNPNTLPELVVGGANVYGGNTPITDITSPTVPGGTPLAVFNTERFDPTAAPEMAWNFAAAPGSIVEVRIGHGEIFNSNTATPGNRTYDIEIDGVIVDTDIDPIADAGAGEGFVTDYIVTADNDGVDIVFIHGADNPSPKSFEIIELAAAPNVAPTVDGFVPASPVTVTQNEVMATVTANASDANGDTITLTTDGNEPAGVTFADLGGGIGEFTGTPTAAPGTYPIVVTATDGEPLSGSATIEIIVTANTPPVIDPIADQTVAEDATFSLGVVANDPDVGDTLTYALSGNVPAGMTIDAAGQIDFTPDLDDSNNYEITVEVDDGVNAAVTEDFVLGVSQTDTGTVLYRVNAGAGVVTSTDAGPDWAEDSSATPSIYLTGGGESTYGGNAPGITSTNITVPASTPFDVFDDERYDSGGSGDMEWSFPIAAGTVVEVRLGHGEIFNASTAAPGFRFYDIEIDGVEVDTDIDAIVRAGNEVGFVTDYIVMVDADGLDIAFLRDQENPSVKSIEIIELVAAPNVAPAIDSFVPASPVTVVQNEVMATITANASDANGDTITLTTDGNEPAGVTFADLGGGIGEFTGTPTAAPGTYSVVVTATDGEPLSGSATIEIIVTANTPPVVDPIADQAISETSTLSLNVVASDADAGDTLVYALSGDVPTGMTIDAAGAISFASTLADSGRYPITVEVDDGVNAMVTEDFTLDVTQTAPPGSAIHRVNVGGSAEAATDSSYPDFVVDTSGTPYPYYSGGGGGFATGNIALTDSSHPTVPGYAPTAMFNTERYGPTNWAIPVDAGTVVEVRLYWAEVWSGATGPGVRVFDVNIDGTLVEDDLDIYDEVGPGVAYVTDYLITSDGMIDIGLVTGAQSPALKGIEILGISGAPSIDLLSPADGATISTDSVTIDWDLNGFLDPNDHVHVTLDAPPHTSVFRPATEFTLTGLTDGTHTITVSVADVAHNVYTNPEATQTITITVDTAAPLVTRISAGGALATATDGGPDWEAGNSPNHSTLTTPSGSTTGAWPVNGFHSSVPIYAQITELFGFERYDGSNGAAPDVMTYTIPVSAAGVSATVNLFMMSGWNGASGVGQREYDVYIEGVLVLDDFDPVAAYGHRMGGMESLAVTDDGDGFITIVFDHGPVENPTVSAIEVIG